MLAAQSAQWQREQEEEHRNLMEQAKRAALQDGEASSKCRLQTQETGRRTRAYSVRLARGTAAGGPEIHPRMEVDHPERQLHLMTVRR